MDFFDKTTTIKRESLEDDASMGTNSTNQPQLKYVKYLNKSIILLPPQKTGSVTPHHINISNFVISTNQSKPGDLHQNRISQPSMNKPKLNHQNIIILKPTATDLNVETSHTNMKFIPINYNNVNNNVKIINRNLIIPQSNAAKRGNSSGNNFEEPADKKIKYCHVVNPNYKLYDECRRPIPRKYNFENQEIGEMKYNDAYSQYQAARLKYGKDHPYVVVESRSLSTEKAPGIKYELKMPREVIEKGILSNVQLEAVIYACQKHTEILTDGRRAGFLIGDGAGVGKGRTIAGIIYENFLSNRKRAIWISVCNDLKEDAKRDLNDVTQNKNISIKVKSLNKMKYSKINSKENRFFNEGVLFVTYSSLISTCKNNNKNCMKTRFEQIVKWFGKDYDGLIVFDECHKAKNLHQGNKTKTGTLVKKLQDQLKQARIVYASATGASEPKHMAYMVRLGLWGPEKPFKKFDEFENVLSKNGVGAMELVAMEMKRKGLYLARQLSFEDVKFEIQETKIENVTINGHIFKDVYNKSVKIWSDIFVEFKAAFNRNKNVIDKEENMFTAQYWSAHQRFFKYLCISAKIQECIHIAKREIDKGKCIVIGLQSTGESSTLDALENNSGELFDFVSSAKSVIKSLIENHYPSKKNLIILKEKRDAKYMFTLDHSKLNKIKSEKFTKNKDIEKYKAETESEEDSEIFSSSDESSDDETQKCQPKYYTKSNKFEEEMADDEDKFSDDYINKQKMLKLIDDVDSMFPMNALDELILKLGGPNKVAELTGRKGRMVEIDGKVSYQSRREGEIALDQVNLIEKDRFNNGEKLVAIISDAASTGISLHSDKRFENKRQRFHITLELPWSADKAIQQFGRTHRSNQVIPPHYLFLISDLAGERRFAATVAKRLETLGALTHGDRRCADTRDLSQFNIDNEFGLKAVRKLLLSIYNYGSTPTMFPLNYLMKYNNNFTEFREVAKMSLKNVGLNVDLKSMSVSKFLNRLLGIELDMQNTLFQYFLILIEGESDKALRSNNFNHGIRDVMNDEDNIFRNDDPIIFKIGKKDEDNIEIHKVTNISTGVSWGKAVQEYLKNSTENYFCVNNTDKLYVIAYAEYQQENEYKLITPNLPVKCIDKETLQTDYRKIEIKEAERLWETFHKESENKCHHVMLDLFCENQYCHYGKRTKINYIITGSIFLSWSFISKAYPSVKMQIVRVQLNDGSKLVGSLIERKWYPQIEKVLRKESQIFSDSMYK